MKKFLLALFSLCSLSTGSVFSKNSLVKKNSTEFRLLSLARNSLDIEHTLLCLQQHFRCWSRKNLDFLSFLPKSSLFGHLFSQCSNSAVWLLFRDASFSSAAAFSPNCLLIKRRRRKEQAGRMCLFKWRVLDGQLAILFIVLACVIPPQFSAVLNCSELNELSTLWMLPAFIHDDSIQFNSAFFIYRNLWTQRGSLGDCLQNCFFLLPEVSGSRGSLTYQLVKKQEQQLPICLYLIFTQICQLLSNLIASVKHCECVRSLVS